MSKVIHEQNECRKQARESKVAKMARNVLTIGYCETPVASRVNDPLLVSRNAEDGLTVRVKDKGQYCTVFRLYRGSVQKYHNPIPAGIDWVCLLKQWSDETSLRNDFTCEAEC